MAVFGGNWIWPILGLIFLPRTTVMFTRIVPVCGFDWVWLGLGVRVDISATPPARRGDASFYRVLQAADDGRHTIPSVDVPVCEGLNGAAADDIPAVATRRS